MEGEPGSPCGPPEAKRPRLEEEAPCASQAPEGGHVSTEPPRPRGAPSAPLLLEGPPPCEPVTAREQEGEVGGRACRGSPPKKRRAPSAARGGEESPAPKTPRRAPAEEVRAWLRGGAARGPPRPLSVGGTGGAAPGRRRSAALWSGGRVLATVPARPRPDQAIRAEAAPPRAPPRSGHGPPPARPRARAPLRGGGAQDAAGVPRAAGRGSPGSPSPAPTPRRAAGEGGSGRIGAFRVDPAPGERGASAAAVAARGGPRGPAGLPGDEDAGPHVRAALLGAPWVSSRRKECPEGSRRISRFLPDEGRSLEGENPATAFEIDHLSRLSFEFLHYLDEIPKWKFRNLNSENNDNRTKSVLLKTRRGNTVQGNNLLLTIYKTSDSAFNLDVWYEHSEVRECMPRKEGNYVSEVARACHIITTENISSNFKKYRDNSFHVIPKDTLFSVFDTFEKVSLLSDFGDTDNISLSKRDYANSASSEKASSLEALDALNIKDIPQVIPNSQINTTEHVHKTNTNSQDTVTEKKQIFYISSFNFKGEFIPFLDIEQQVKNYDTIYIGPNVVTKTQEKFVGNFLSEGKEKIQSLIWSEITCPTESFVGMHSYQISNGSKVERKEKCSITTSSTVVCILKSNLLMIRKPNLEDAREINQNSTADRNEYQTILQESASANSKHFHPNNEFTEFVNHKFKTDLATRNNEYLPDLQAECLSTETKTMSDFEMKSKFDIVLKELCMFCEIGKEEETSANSRLFHLENESTEFNHKLKTDLITRNNKCSLDLTAECLSTETKTASDFQMKSEFDIVLKELCLFHEIGKEEEAWCIGETRHKEEKNDFAQDNSMEEVHQKIKENLTVVSMEKIHVPSLPCDTVTSVDVPKTARSSFKWEEAHMDRQKEVPHEYCPSSPSDDKLLHSLAEGDFEKAFSQNPALFSDAFMEGRIHSLLKGGSSLSNGIVRVYPLKTCCGPIRIGLSRKAKPKQLHPYLK